MDQDTKSLIRGVCLSNALPWDRADQYQVTTTESGSSNERAAREETSIFLNDVSFRFVLLL